MDSIRNELAKLADPALAKNAFKFFKTGKGQYAEGDVFIGVSVPKTRKIARKFCSLPLFKIENLLKSRIHEERLAALIILIKRYSIADHKKKQRIYKFYIKNVKYVNSWDLVDLSAANIVGAHVFNKQRDILYKLARSPNIWKRRISIISTYYFIKNGQFEDTLKLSKLLLKDECDLIQKAVGWMLREVGKRDQKTEERFLLKNYKRMPRTTLRYAIERFDRRKRASFLAM